MKKLLVLIMCMVVLTGYSQSYVEVGQLKWMTEDVGNQFYGYDENPCPEGWVIPSTYNWYDLMANWDTLTNREWVHNTLSTNKNGFVDWYGNPHFAYEGWRADAYLLSDRNVFDPVNGTYQDRRFNFKLWHFTVGSLNKDYAFVHSEMNPFVEVMADEPIITPDGYYFPIDTLSVYKYNVRCVQPIVDFEIKNYYFTRGWNPFIPHRDVNAEDFFSVAGNKFVLVKSVKGEIYWKAIGFNDIGTLKEGMFYLTYFSDNQNIEVK
jgi:hypothetical protein